MISPEKDITKLSTEEKQERIRLQKEKVALFSNSQKQQREVWVVAEFMNNLGIRFGSEELTAGDDPPDVNFRDATFEIKEVDETNRKRGDENREYLEKVKSATHLEDIMTPYKFKTICMPEVINRIQETLEGLIYDIEFCKKIDILFYINYSLIGEHSYTISKNNLWVKWRSISMVTNNGISCVFFANNDAPQFIKAINGKVINRQRDKT